MITLALFINLLSHITCQQMQSWTSFPQPTAVVYQQPYIGSDYSQRLQNQQNYQAYQQYIPQSSYPLTQWSTTTNIPSKSSIPSPNSPFIIEEPSPLKRVTGSQIPITLNLPQKKTEISSPSPIPNTVPSILKSQSIEPIAYTSLPITQFPTPQTTQTQKQFSSLTPSVPSFISAPSSSTSKAPRSIIPSPLTETMSLQYPSADPFRNVFELPEPTLGSVGCLALTMTPYGTISETPLPDPSTPLPRSPYLPVSSPVSALAPPLSPLLPPAIPASRASHFLRKVPVPPPFI